jgi:hypothetical protein
MKEYNEYMDNISVEAELHEKIMRGGTPCGKMPRKKRIARPLFRSMALSATAAAVALCFVLSGHMKSQTINSFSIKAYALELRENGSIGLRDYELHELGTSMVSSISITGDNDEFFYHNLYRSIYLDVKGENIKSVEVFTEGGGDFIKARFLTGNGEFIDTEYGLIKLSEEHLGNSFNLDDLGSMENGYVLFAGRPGRADDSFYLSIRAVASFFDGTIQEETIELYMPMPER